tara:strand:+ start:359 stop:493 length:135 start_codon:yes stop_codon:yes gene_type:complete
LKIIKEKEESAATANAVMRDNYIAERATQEITMDDPAMITESPL